MSRIVLVGIACATLVLARVDAGAAETPPTSEPSSGVRKAAEAHFKIGKVQLDVGNYDEAIKEFRAAYALVGAENTFFYLGEAHRLKGERREALEHYRKYIAAKPGGSKTDEARRHIEALSLELKSEEEAAVAKATPSPERAPAPANTERPGDSESLAVKSSAATEARPATPPAPVLTDRARHLRLAGIGLLAAGIAGLGAGIGVGLAADGKAAAIRELASRRGDFDAPLEDDRVAFRRAAIGCLVAGSVIAVVGATALGAGIAQRRDAHASPAAAAISITPVLGPGAAGLSLHGSF